MPPNVFIDWRAGSTGSQRQQYDPIACRSSHFRPCSAGGAILNLMLDFAEGASLPRKGVS